MRLLWFIVLAALVGLSAVANVNAEKAVEDPAKPAEITSQSTLEISSEEGGVTPPAIKDTKEGPPNSESDINEDDKNENLNHVEEDAAGDDPVTEEPVPATEGVVTTPAASGGGGGGGPAPNKLTTAKTASSTKKSGEARVSACVYALMLPAVVLLAH